MTKEEKREYNKRYYQANRETILKQQQGYRLTNKEEKKEHRKQYRQANREKIRKRKHEYYLKNRGEEIENVERWREENPERTREIGRKHNHKRRHLGFNPLNEWFEGSEAHHINFNDIIYIPKSLHRSIPHCLEAGKNMNLINKLAYQFLFGNYIIYK